MRVLTNGEQRYRSYLAAIQPIIYKQMDAYLINKKWGMETDVCAMKELKRLRTFGLLLEWNTSHINQHHLQYDSNGCPILCHPSQLPEAALFEPCQKEKPKCCDCCGETEKPPIGGWIQRFNCLHVNIKPALTAWGHWPANRFPDI